MVPRGRASVYYSEVPFYNKPPILWYHYIDFVISQNRFSDITKYIRLCYITKSILWYQNIELAISQKWISDITKLNLFGISQNWINVSLNFVISLIRFCDITNSIKWYH